MEITIKVSNKIIQQMKMVKTVKMVPMAKMAKMAKMVKIIQIIAKIKIRIMEAVKLFKKQKMGLELLWTLLNSKLLSSNLLWEF